MEESDDDDDDEYDPYDYFSGADLAQLEQALSGSSMLLGDLAAMKERGQERLVSLRTAASHRRGALESALRARRAEIRAKIERPSFVLTVDKASFVFFIMLLMLTELVLLTAPRQLYVLYSVIILPLMLARYWTYKKDKFHYFMYDFCYFAQVILLISLYALPTNQTAAQLNFAVANGPLAWAVVLWKNSLVFHSVDKMTSSFIHLLPPLVTFSMRWDDSLATRTFPRLVEPFGSGVVMTATTAEVTKTTGAILLQLMQRFVLVPLAAYGVWQLLYLIKTEVISRRKLETDPEIMTSLRWLTKDTRSMSYKVITSLGPQRKTSTFVLFQFVYTFVTLLPTILMWHSMLAHAAFLAALFVVALVNGASYYFSVFATRYMDKLSSRKSASSNTNNDEIINSSSSQPASSLQPQPSLSSSAAAATAEGTAGGGTVAVGEGAAG
uniref:Glycerophosphocholine acyltransferase 1 n=1 Tax=Erythrolobus madagascarensis TaxID=708628 RepID=A0A7S0T9D0_9RHOD